MKPLLTALSRLARSWFRRSSLAAAQPANAPAQANGQSPAEQADSPTGATPDHTERAAKFRGRWDTHNQKDEHQSALNEIDQAIAFAPRVGEYHYCRAKTLSHLRRWGDVLPAVETAIELGHNGSAAYTLLGHALYSAGRIEAAESAYAESLRTSPKDSTTLTFWALCQWKLDRIEAAEDGFDAAELAAPNDAGPVFERGRMLYEIAEYGRAITYLERAAELSPKNKDYRLWRGAAYSQLGYHDLTIDEVEDGMAMGTPSAVDYRWRGEAYGRLNEHASALADFERAIELEPGNAMAHNWRGWLLMELGRLDEARRAYDEAIRLNPTSAICYEQRSKVWDQLGQDDRAAADFETCLELELKTNPPTDMNAPATDLYPIVRAHFSDTPLEQLTLTERFFPVRVSPDAQRALDSLADTEFKVDQFLSPKQNNNAVYNFQALYTRDRRNPITASAPHHYEVDIGADKPVRCLWTGAWLLTYRETRFAVLTTADQNNRRFQVAAPATPAGEAVTAEFLALLEAAIARGECYRGKVLSLEEEDDYHGTVSGLKVHRLRPVRREDVILPGGTLDLLDRNVIEFVQARPRLRELGLATKKGLLFHGPPGTGKTHTIHYLTGALPGTTTFLITAEQVGHLSEYMTLARLLQPSLVVIEDVDLIARERRALRSGVEETLLNRLLNEMDGLKPDADILFILTTNAPAALEEALANRPGRVDQAIEFPYPDAEGRAKLVRMYAGKTLVADDVVERIARRKEQMSPAFIKELMRRAAQPAVMRGSTEIEVDDVEKALAEMFHAGGLNGKLFGFGGRVE